MSSIKGAAQTNPALPLMKRFAHTTFAFGSVALVAAAWLAPRQDARAGNLFVSFHGEIHEFSPAGVDLGTFAATGLNRPDGLAFDSSGNLFVANNGDNTVHKFGPTGLDLGTFARTGLSGPTSIAIEDRKSVV